MRLKKIKLHPFAGISNHTFDFTDGLNVVVGPTKLARAHL